LTAEPKKGALPQGLRKLWKNGLFRSSFLIAIVVLSVLAFREALIFTLKTEYPLQTPVSGSMVPTLNVGDLLIVQGVPDASNVYAHPGDGDIIVFRDPYNPNDLIVHRAIDKLQIGGTWCFTTKGDANPSPDPWRVPESDVVGKVVWHIPYLGYIKIYMGTPIGMLLSIVLLLAILILDSLNATRKENKQQTVEEKVKGEPKTDAMNH